MKTHQKLELLNLNTTSYEIQEPGELLLIYQGEQDSEYKERLEFIVKKPELEHTVKIKAVLKDNAKLDIEVVLRVAKGAKNTNTYLKIDCLMLSNQAHVEVIPSLEIMEDSVKSGHGATVSSINKEQLHYLQSRGLTYSQAESLIVDGFLK